MDLLEIFIITQLLLNTIFGICIVIAFRAIAVQENMIIDLGYTIGHLRMKLTHPAGRHRIDDYIRYENGETGE